MDKYTAAGGAAAFFTGVSADTTAMFYNEGSYYSSIIMGVLTIGGSALSYYLLRAGSGRVMPPRNRNERKETRRQEHFRGRGWQ